MAKQSNPPEPIEVFISYSHKDEKLRIELEKHLSALKRQGAITSWSDRKIGPGKEWEGQIDAHLNSANIVLLLISPDFMASDYCNDVEVARAMERHKAREATVVPIMLRPCDTQGTPFDGLQALPIFKSAVTHWRNRDEAFKNVASGIRTVVEELGRTPKPMPNNMKQFEDSGIALGVSDFKVPDVVPEFIFVSEDSPPLTTQGLRCEFEDTTTPLPSILETAKREYIEQKKKEASLRNQTLNNNKGYSLYSISVDREQDESGHRQRVFKLRLRPTDYFSGSVFPNLALDETIEVAGTKTTAREVLGLSRDKLRFDNLMNYACHFPLFTATVFITSDNKAVIPIRSKSQFIAGGNTYHLSSAEGMLRPIDEYEHNHEPSPFLTVTRSFEEELGLKRGVDFIPEHIRCLGLLLDTFRAHPFCIFYLRSSETKFDDLKSKWLKAKDRFEAKDVVGMDWNERNAGILVGGKFQYRGDLITIASNHAQSGWLLAALYEFGEISL